MRNADWKRVVFFAMVQAEREENPMATYVLVHGAWHGGWC